MNRCGIDIAHNSLNPILVLGSKMSNERIVRALLLTNIKTNPCLKLLRSLERNFCRAPLLYKELVVCEVCERFQLSSKFDENFRWIFDFSKMFKKKHKNDKLFENTV